MYLLIAPKPESKGMLEVGTLRKWRLQACPELGSPIPGSLVWFCSPSKPLPSSSPWVGQSLKGISALVGVDNSNNKQYYEFGEHLFSRRPVLRALDVSQPLSCCETSWVLLLSPF